jgi:hypothetical protein
MMLRRLLPALGQTLLGDEMGIVKELWQLKSADGSELEAFLAYDSNLGAKITVTIRGCHGENILAEELAVVFRGLLEERGTISMSEAAE